VAYVKRLYLTFQDDKDAAWTTEVYQDGYGGLSTEMVMGAEPVVIRCGGDKWKNIIGSECTIVFNSSDDVSWLILQMLKK